MRINDCKESFGIPTDEKLDLKFLKTRYRFLAAYYHPDQPNGNTHFFKIITEAYHTLLNNYKADR